MNRRQTLTIRHGRKEVDENKRKEAHRRQKMRSKRWMREMMMRRVRNRTKRNRMRETGGSEIEEARRGLR